MSECTMQYMYDPLWLTINNSMKQGRANVHGEVLRIASKLFYRRCGTAAYRNLLWFIPSDTGLIHPKLVRYAVLSGRSYAKDILKYLSI